MAKHERMIRPKPDVQTYLNQFGSVKELCELLHTLDEERASPALVSYWKKKGIPASVYGKLELILSSVDQEALIDELGFLEVYYNGVMLGQFHLSKGIQLKCRIPKKRKTTNQSNNQDESLTLTEPSPNEESN